MRLKPVFSSDLASGFLNIGLFIENMKRPSCKLQVNRVNQLEFIQPDRPIYGE
jgi:hypothetical protein